MDALIGFILSIRAVTSIMRPLLLGTDQECCVSAPYQHYNRSSNSNSNNNNNNAFVGRGTKRKNILCAYT
jgi:hypothetical protein